MRFDFSPAMQRRAAWIAATIAVIAYYPRFIKDAAGLQVYSAAAECLLRGEIPLQCATPDFVSPFVYPPFLALLSVPVAVLPTVLRELVWYGVLIGTLFFALRFCELLARRLFPGAWTEPELAQFRILTFVLGLKFMLAVLENQAFDSIALVFILGGLLALTGGRPLVAGACLATATALKITPLLFLPYLLIKRRFLAAAAFVVVVVLLTFLPDLLLPPAQGSHGVLWLKQVVLAQVYKDPDTLYPTFWMNNSPMNQSFRAAIARVVFGEEKDLILSTQVEVLLRIVMAVYIVGVSITMLKSLFRDRLIPVDGALLIVSALLLSPVSSQSHFVGIMLGYALLAAAFVRVPALRSVMGAFMLLSFVLVTATSNDVAGRALTSFALWHSFPMWGTLTLAVGLCVLIWMMARGRDGQGVR